MQTRALVDFGELSLNRGDAPLRACRGFSRCSRARLLPLEGAPDVVRRGTDLRRTPRRLGEAVPDAVPEIPLVFFSRLLLTVLPTLLSLVLLDASSRSTSAETSPSE